MCRQISQFDSTVDKALVYYWLKNAKSMALESFLLDDQLFLVRIYILLVGNGRLGTKKIIKPEDELGALDRLVKYVCKKYLASNTHQLMQNI